MHLHQEGKGQWMLAKSCSEGPQRDRQESTLARQSHNEEQREGNEHTSLPLGHALTSRTLFNPQ